MIGAFCRDDWRVRGEREVDAGVGDQVCLWITQTHGHVIALQSITIHYKNTIQQNNTFITTIHFLQLFFIPVLVPTHVDPSSPDSDPPENCHLNVKKIAKDDIFFQKNSQNLSFF